MNGEPWLALVRFPVANVKFISKYQYLPVIVGIAWLRKRTGGYRRRKRKGRAWKTGLDIFLHSEGIKEAGERLSVRSEYMMI